MSKRSPSSPSLVYEVRELAAALQAEAAFAERQGLSAELIEQHRKRARVITEALAALEAYDDFAFNVGHQGACYRDNEQHCAGDNPDKFLYGSMATAIHRQEEQLWERLRQHGALA